LSGDVRRLTLDNLPGCLDLAADREWPREERKWRLLFELGEVLGIVETGEGVVGTTVITCYDPGAAISMVLVAARREWRGFASRMMRAAMEHAGSGPVVLYATEYGRRPDAAVRAVDASPGLAGSPPDNRSGGRSKWEQCERVATPAGL
jgi:ribosomal protein S18 acetylase RimI-like enzyme